MTKTIDGAAFREMIISAHASIELHKQQVNELNVFPVPDSDTGTNMCLTIASAAAEMKKSGDDHLGKAATAAAGALLRGARGNSGVILSLLFRGFGKYLKDKPACTGVEFAAALAEGVEAAYKAVMKPAEGTILTVSRVSSVDAAVLADQDDDVLFVLQGTIESAKEALAKTIDQNPVLKRAGVVDAGGMGYVYILEGMLAALQGQPIEFTADMAADEPRDHADFSDFETEDITFQYCTEFIVSRENDKDPEELRTYLNGMGDSLVLVDDDEIIKVHVHTNHPGEVLETALSYGSFVTVKVENMKLQHSEKVMSEAEKAAAQIAKPEKRYGFVAVCAGTGLAEVFRDLGADGIIEGGQTMNPSTEDILKQINKTPAEVVFVLPNNKNIIMAAEQCIPLSEEKQVIVLPTKTVPQGITAMLSFDPDSDEGPNAAAMTGAAEGVTTMQVTYAARDSEFDGLDIHQGDYLSMIDGALFETGPDINAQLAHMAAKASEMGGSYVTVFFGEDVAEAEAQQAQQIFQQACPDLEVALISGGQPVYYYLISVE